MIENMTIDELLSWANGLGICSFVKKRDGTFGDEIICAKGDVEIKMRFGRFTDSVPDHGGMRNIHFSALDKRNGGWSGMGAPLVTLGEAAHYIELYAAKLDLADEQMSIFSLL